MKKTIGLPSSNGTRRVFAGLAVGGMGSGCLPMAGLFLLHAACLRVGGSHQLSYMLEAGIRQGERLASEWDPNKHHSSRVIKNQKNPSLMDECNKRLNALFFSSEIPAGKSQAC